MQTKTGGAGSPNNHTATTSGPPLQQHGSGTMTLGRPSGSVGVYAPRVPPALVDAAEAALPKADSWAFDAFELQEATQGHALSSLSYFLIHRAGLIRRFNINAVTLARWVLLASYNVFLRKQGAIAISHLTSMLQAHGCWECIIHYICVCCAVR